MGGLLNTFLPFWKHGYLAKKANAVADVLFGAHNPQALPQFLGRWGSCRALQLQQHFSNRTTFTDYWPLYPLYGLSYTTFEYSDLQLSAAQITVPTAWI